MFFFFYVEYNTFPLKQVANSAMLPDDRGPRDGHRVVVQSTAQGLLGRCPLCGPTMLRPSQGGVETSQVQSTAPTCGDAVSVKRWVEGRPVSVASSKLPANSSPDTVFALRTGQVWRSIDRYAGPLSEPRPVHRATDRLPSAAFRGGGLRELVFWRAGRVLFVKRRMPESLHPHVPVRADSGWSSEGRLPPCGLGTVASMFHVRVHCPQSLLPLPLAGGPKR